MAHVPGGAVQRESVHTAALEGAPILGQLLRHSRVAAQQL